MSIDEELLDNKIELKERRGMTLTVLCVLSWIAIGLSFLGMIWNLIKGKKTEAELLEDKIEQLSAVPDGPAKEMTLNIMQEGFVADELANQYFFELMAQNVLTLILGFFAVLLMFKLKKIGFYLYLLYCAIPIAVSIGVFGVSGFMSIIIIGVLSIISLVFVILYGYQLKRMS